jgi:eukaryotic-like serine/threonine-protein kinase
MATTVTLTITEERTPRKQVVFRKPTSCLVGRAADCDLQMPGDREHLSISRHHCLLEVDPPEVWIRDLRSMNGTFVNGARIGLVNGLPVFEDVVLHEGDEFRLGQTTFRVDIGSASLNGEVNESPDEVIAVKEEDAADLCCSR